MRPAPRFVIACLTLTAACHRVDVDVVVGSGVALAEQRRVTPFQALDVSGSAVVLVSRAAAPSVSVTADANVVPVVTTTVVGGTLVVRFERPGSGGRAPTPVTVEPKVPITIRIATPGLGRVALAGAITLEASGLAADAFTLSAAGAAKGTLVGAAKLLTVTVSGAGKLDLGRLRAETAIVKVSGAADVTVSASSKLDVEISGAARVGYYGNPTVARHVTGAGRVSQLGAAAP
ncbi:MAG TPA: DUF2807 domain-containing protein [Polyangia bacterium]